MSSPQGDAEELVRRYKSGDRQFAKIRLAGANLARAHLAGANFIRANLEGANLEGANLEGANLAGANIRNANLARAPLGGANLVHANLEGAQLSGADLESANLMRARLGGAILEAAHLRNTNLDSANIERANLRNANLRDANLRNADLQNASLQNARLKYANLVGANLENVDLWNARLDSTNLAGANLAGANLVGAYLGGADLFKARLAGAFCTTITLGNTRLIATSLTALCDVLPTIRFVGPCSIDHESIQASIQSPNLKSFLQKSGMPEVFIEYMLGCAQSLATDVFRMLKSTFISFGGPDEPFARKLYEALHRNGVTTFFFPEHAVPGDKLHRMMRKGVNEHERVILICSKSSLDRAGVLNEIEETLAREAREGGASYLIPIRLDGYVFSGWNPPNPDTAQTIRDRVVANFEGADTDQAKFDAALFTLIKALKK